ncbi:Serine/threonine-protein kinase ATR [Gryllus bimaculatus]|nr:Serine/threonine-protein kinase ATR [Gryllus bimaculatus]
MITNSSGHKLKAFRSTRDFGDVKDSEAENRSKLTDKGSDKEKLSDTTSDGIGHRASSSIVICQRDRIDNRLKPRPRPRDDFRMARGGVDRRSTNVRGRGACLPRKGDRDNESGYIPRGKFQESLNKGSSSETVISSSSKYFNDADNKTRSDYGYLVPEDSRISKLLRRLSREDDPDKFCSLAKQLQESLMVPENGRYIKRAFDLITESLLDLLHTGPGSEPKLQAAKCLGRFGYVLDQDFKRYIDWVFSTYSVERNEEVRLLLMKAIYETLHLDKETLKTKEYASTLMSSLQNALEFTDSADFLIGTVDVILLLTEMYPTSFSKHFRDTVDILVGWHIDSSLKSQITEYASRSLQKLNRFWIVDLQFSVTLISQFLEDMEAYGDDIHVSNDQSGRSTPDEEPILSPEQCIIKITSLIKVFNTVLKCLGQHLNPILSPTISWSFLINCFTKMLQTVLRALEFLVREELIIAANECASLLLTFLQTKISSTNGKLYSLINMELRFAGQLGEEAIISMLTFIAKVVRDVSANLPVELVQDILGPESPILKLRFSPSKKIQNEVLGVYHSLLNLKNIPPLQEAYRYVLGDLEMAYKQVVPSISELCQSNPLANVKYNDEDVEMVIMFHMKALADLANASSSIIGMWALQPSILELLAVKLQPYHKNLVNYSPMLQYCIIYLLYSHCARYNNFVSSSGLVSAAHGVSNVCDILGLPINLGTDVPTSSPTSGHLSVILTVLTQVLSEVSSKQTMCLILGWTGEVICQAQSYLNALQDSREFCDLLQALVKAGHTQDVYVASLVLKNLEDLLSSSNILWKHKFLTNVLNLCLLHSNSSENDVSVKACHLMTLLPWYITIRRIQELTEPKKGNVKNFTFALESLHDVQKHHMSKATYGDMHGIHFKKLMGYILHGTQCLEQNWMLQMFHSCWPVQAPRSLSPEDAKVFVLFTHLAWTNNVILMLWSTWQAAQFCISAKLRTPLGKPQETFTSIEGSIKDLARDLHTMLNPCQVEDVLEAPDTCSTSSVLTSSSGVSGSLTTNVFESPSTSSSTSNAVASTSSSTSTSALQHDSQEEEPKSQQSQKQPSTPTEPVVCIQTHDENWEQRRVRLLLEFLEHLEKCIHNAAEGSASSLPPCQKTVRIFFHTNKSTCAEWLTRIRMAVLMVALHAGQATAVGSEFERTVLYLSWALCQLREPEAIVGLLVWCREHGRKFPWLKAVAEQAAGRYEAAAEDYKRFLDTECSSHTPSSSSEEYVLLKPGGLTNKIDSEHFLSEFISDQLFGNSFTAKQAEAMNSFEEHGLSALSELEKWSSVGSNPINADKCWNSCVLLKQVDSTLANVALTLAADCNTQKTEGKDFSEEHSWMKSVIESCMVITKRHVQEGLRNMPSESLQNCVISQFAGAGLLSVVAGEPEKNAFTMADTEIKPNYAKTSVLTNILWWATYFDQMSGKRFHNQVNGLCLEVSRIARKEGNYKLANKLLLRFLSSGGGFGMDSSAFKQISLQQVVESLIDSSMSFGEAWDISIARAYIEVAKLLYSSNCHNSAVQVCALTSLAIVQQPTGISLELEERKSRTLLTLAKWLQVETHLVTEIRELLTQVFAWENSSPNKDMKVLDSMTLEHCNLLLQNGTQVIPPTDTVVGRLLYMSVCQCPTLAKSWSNFAAWCYRWGRRVVDAASEAGGQLTEVDRDSVQQILSPGIPGHDLEKVYSILSQTKTVDDEEDIEVEDYNTSEMIETQLQTVRSLSGASREQLSLLVDIWRSAQKRVYVYYELSAVAYFKFLELCGDGEGTDCTTITATLRLLRLIVKHALELQGVLELGLDSTPTRPWKGIIPQLFSRLSHPEPYVRRRVSELLCRVAEDAPHLITFPAVVGAATGTRLKDMNIPSSTSIEDDLDEDGDDDEDDDEDDEDDDEDDDDDSVTAEENKVSVLKNCFLAMVDILAKQAPEAISQVKLLVQELRRITLLWDELWLGTLVQHHAEITRRLSQLELEVIRVDENMSLAPDLKKHLIAEKHRIILKPSNFKPSLQFLLKLLTKNGDYIKDALQKLKSPVNPRRPHESWQPMKQLQTRLQQRSQKRAAYTIHMSDVSPALAELKKTVIAMPGVSSSERNFITIAAVDNNVAILPTKTKPKKLVFHGSDGQMYTYLFKGLEDLHLDERIMQFLSIANTMMQRGSGTQLYYARHYSVIPLGPRSGLISWVDGVTPLFSLYKRWQQREIVSVTLKIHASTGPLNPAPQVLRPSELFYNKLGPLLKERGITNVENRKDWPLPVLRQVLTELMEETPKDLLAKELWCNSINSGSWWQTTRRYSYSVAVMSMIGYIIGLGDRHLDNVLVDLSTGEVVHIDYNVCFEKGKTLRVPEKVPFRMTPNIRTALGVTGVEGIFRQASEHVLKVMKKGRETLLTLLEAFVYDPLIDWKPGNEAGYTGAVYGGQAVALESKQSRKELEREVTQSMFCVRMTEMKCDWLSNRDDLLAAMPQLESYLKNWTDIQDQIKTVEELFQDCHQQMALVKEAEAHGPGGQHPLYTLGTRYTKYRRARDAMEKAKATLKDKLEDTEKHYKLQKAALSAVRGTQLGGWVADLNFPTDKDDHLVFDLVKEFLQNAGQSQMILQCEQSETELGQLAQQQTILIRTCLDLLSQYGAIAGLYPNSYFKKHRIVCFHRWTKYLLESLSIERYVDCCNVFNFPEYTDISDSCFLLLFSINSCIRFHEVCEVMKPAKVQYLLVIEHSFVKKTKCHDVAAQFQSFFSPDNITNNPLCRTAVSFSYQLQSALQEANVRFSNALEKMTSKGLPEGTVTFEKDYDDAHKAIENFLASDPTATLALECVNVTALCSLNKRYLMMEAAAASAGDCLVDLTSRDGEWFLDEMHFVSTLVSEFSSILPYQRNPASPEADEIPSLRLALQCLYSANVIFRGLKELNFNFHTIILPEALKALQTEEPTVISVIETLDEIIQSIGCPITELLAQLELHLRYVIMDMESPHSHVQTIVYDLRTKYESLLLHSHDIHRDDFVGDEGLSPGKMLLMGFNGLFEKLQLEGAALVTALETIETPPSWKKVDQVREAKSLSAPVFSDRTRAVLDSIFLLKRLQTIQDFFAMCSQMARMGSPIYDDDRLNKPIRRFTADYVRRQMLGVSSQTLALAICFLLHQRLGLNVTVEVEQRDIGAESKVSLEELIHKAVDLCVKRGKVSTATLAQVSGLTSNLESAWRRRELAISAQQECEVRRSTSQRLQLQLTAHHWLYEDLLLQNAPMSTLLPINRTTFMREVRKTSSALLALQARLNEAQEQQNILVASVEQRLKWAAGANPALNEVMAAFECALQKRTTRLGLEQRLAAVVGNTCNAILHHEALRTRTSEAIANDTSFMQMLEQLEKSCILSSGCEHVITSAEEALVQLLIPEGCVDINWIHKAELLISDKVKSLQEQKGKLHDDLFTAQENLKKHVMTIRGFLSVHHRLVSDVRNLLKSMAKSESGICSGLNDYLSSYKKFSECFSTLIRDLMIEDIDTESIQQALDQLQIIKAKTGAIYEELLQFADDLREQMKPKTTSEEMFTYGKLRRPPLTRQEGLYLSPKKGSPAVVKNTKTGRDPRTGKAVQERNAYALGVWRRVRMKLEGRDPDLNRKISVQEQVDYVTREAMSLDNLALLYEGWTPWVNMVPNSLLSEKLLSKGGNDFLNSVGHSLKPKVET